MKAAALSDSGRGACWEGATALCALLLYAACACAHAQCGTAVRIDSGGDYIDPKDSGNLRTVESAHFTKDVENLVRGASSRIGDDLAYTLGHFPNHHRALASIARMALRYKTGKVPGAKFTVVCYFERAIQFSPKDASVRMIYASYLLAVGQPDTALLQLREAVQQAPRHPTLNYNLGLLYAKRKDYEQARIYAWRAYELGFPLPGLKNQLSAAGQWQEAPPKPPESHAAPATPAEDEGKPQSEETASPAG